MEVSNNANNLSESELFAIAMAAISAYLGDDKFVIKGIKKSSSNWAKNSRQQFLEED